MKQARTLMQSWVNSNLFIALAALGLTWQTCLQTTANICLNPLSLLIFLGTLHVYIAQRLVKLDARKNYDSAGMSHWLDQHKLYVRAALAVSLIGSGICFFFLKTQTQIGLVILAGVSMLYALPLLFWLKGRPRLRDFGILKPFILGLVWAVTTAVLPMLETGVSIGLHEALIITERSLFIIALCVPFDIKDMAFDDATMTFKTLPLRFGLQTTLRLTLVLLALALAVAVIRWQLGGAGLAETAMYAVSIAVSMFLVSRTRLRSYEYHYTFALDGMLLLQPILIGLAFALGRL